MYNPAHFKFDEPEALHAWMEQYPLATLVTASTTGLDVTQMPLLHDTSGGGFGVLRGHLAKANPQWSGPASGSRALAIFTGPQHYISPNWYPSKAEHGKVVPTWNYVVVHAQGALRVIHDPQWLKQNVSELTAAHEAGFVNPWRVEDAPPDFIENMLHSIVGIEITIEALAGKCKASQNRPEADRAGVVAGLRELGTPDADRMAEIVRQANRIK